MNLKVVGRELESKFRNHEITEMEVEYDCLFFAIDNVFGFVSATSSSLENVTHEVCVGDANEKKTVYTKKMLDFRCEDLEDLKAKIQEYLN